MNAVEKFKGKKNPHLRVLPKVEAKKVSVDDGYTAMPNELLKAILRSKVLGWKGSYLLATILKTLSWRKESDWFTHSQVCEMMGIEPTKYHINQLSAARKELIKEKVLFEDGKKTGVNLAVFDWEMVNPEKVGSSRNNREVIPEIVGNEYPEKVGNTKETITKEKINIPPIVPQGESADAEADTQADVNKKRKPDNTDYQGVIDLFNLCNEETGSRLSMVVALNEKRKRGIKKFLKELKAPTLECVKNYFERFFEDLRPFHWGESERGWRATFDYAIRPDTVLKVREGNL